MIIQCPGYEDCDDAEKAHAGGIDGEIADGGGDEVGRESEEGVAEGREESVEDEEGRARAEFVGEVGGEEDGEKGEEIGGCGEGLGGGGRMSHVC